MHRIIYFIVEADTPDYAVTKAEDDLRELVATKTVDYGTFFDDESSESSGPKRWGKKQIAIKLNTDEGKKKLLSLLRTDYKEFLKNIQEIRRSIQENTNDEIYDDNVDSFYFTAAGERRWLYDGYSGVQNCLEITYILHYYQEQNTLDNVWLVPCDVHT